MFRVDAVLELSPSAFDHLLSQSTRTLFCFAIVPKSSFLRLDFGIISVVERGLTTEDLGNDNTSRILR